MKALIYRYGSIFEPDIIETFLEYGFSVKELTPEMSNKSFSQEEGIALVSRTLLEEPCDFVCSINFYPFLAEVCNIMKLRYICLIVDSPVLELYSTSVRHPWNRIFIFDRVLYEEIAPKNPECVFYMPLAVNVKAKQAVCGGALDKENSGSLVKENARFSSDVSFVGSLYTEKCPYDQFVGAPDYLQGYLNGLMESQLQLYGAYFIEEVLTDEVVTEFKKYTKNFLTLPYSTPALDRVVMSQYYMAAQMTAMERTRLLMALGERFPVKVYTGSDLSTLMNREMAVKEAGIKPCGRVKTQTEMPLVFSESKINLNMTAKSIRSGIPLRVWDILGCGGFCLSNYQPEIPEYFTIGDEIETYGSKEELLEKTAYYLEHENRRKEIAQAGLEKVKKEHTFLIRLAQMMEASFGR